jgi:hypothetical protein
MKYVMLIYQGTAPVPPSEEWNRLSRDEKKAVYAAYRAIDETPGVTPGYQLQPEATIVQVQNGKTLHTDGPFIESKEAVGGFYLFDSDDLNEAIALAAQIPAARMGGAIELRPLVEPSQP